MSESEKINKIQVTAQIKTLIKAKHCYRYRGLEALKKVDRQDYIEVGVPDFRTFWQKLKDFTKNQYVKKNEGIIAQWIYLPVDDLSKYKKGDLIDITVTFTKMEAKAN